MLKDIRIAFNQAFTDERYQRYLDYINQHYPNSVGFRIAETPLFFSKEFKESITLAGEAICHQLIQPALLKQLCKGIPAGFNIDAYNTLPNCILLDFAITENGREPDYSLVELQAFPSLFAYEIIQNNALLQSYSIPNGFSAFLNDYDEKSYLSLLSQLIKGDNPNETILLELDPEIQKTCIDFYCTRDYLNIPIVNIRDIYFKEGKWYYLSGGKESTFKRIYNRIVFDEIKENEAIVETYIQLANDSQLTWFTHPIHFFMYSKYALPYITHPKIPKTVFLDQVNIQKTDFTRKVIKPLFSFAGKGVMIEPTQESVQSITNKAQWICQEKIHYVQGILTPKDPAKAELRIFFLKDPKTNVFKAVFNLARLSKQALINTAQNSNDTWVGGSMAFFEK